MKKIIVIAGPTASGKSARAVELALQYGTDVIGVDSRQIYRDIPILSAVIGHEERCGVNHRLVECMDIANNINAWKYEQMALAEIEDVLQQNDVAIVCGGSMMYIDAIVSGIDIMPDVPENIRRYTIEEYGMKGLEWLQNEVRRIDNDYYDIADTKNPRRLIHALEVYRTTGKPLSSFRTGVAKKRPFEIDSRYLMPEREELYARINLRTEQMIAAGAEAEAKRMYPLRHYNALQTVGFKEMFAYIEGKTSLDEAIEKIKRNTRVYAKKQLLWCRKKLEKK